MFALSFHQACPPTAKWAPKPSQMTPPKPSPPLRGSIKRQMIVELHHPEEPRKAKRPYTGLLWIEEVEKKQMEDDEPQPPSKPPPPQPSQAPKPSQSPSPQRKKLNTDPLLRTMMQNQNYNMNPLPPLPRRRTIINVKAKNPGQGRHPLIV